jgi:hypothetical protein
MERQTREQVERVLAMDDEMFVVSGEGEQGTREAYTGKRSVKAVLSRLTRERCGGDRWARIETADGFKG